MCSARPQLPDDRSVRRARSKSAMSGQTRDLDQLIAFTLKRTCGSEFDAGHSRRVPARAKRLFPIDCRIDDGANSANAGRYKQR
jgi:hypothetical protein